jgi:pSer/pThr/pTyr-binding forkhead associated (FHA) protein
MALTVIVRSGDLATPASITFDAPRIIIGRGNGCEVFLPDPSVSHRHASIRQRGSDYVVIDEGSTNGTFAGSVRLSPQAPRVVTSGDLIRVGRVWLEIKVEHVPVTLAPKSVTREIALALVSSALGAQGEPPSARILVQKGPAQGAELLVPIDDKVRVIGRGVGVDLPLEDPDLSRRQIEIFRRGVNIVLRDLGSKNGSYLDADRLESGKDTPWPLEKTLVIGQSELTYEDPVRAALAELESSEDERLRADDEIAPPTGVPAPPLPKGFSGPSLAPEGGASAPIAEVPARRAEPRATGGVRGFDVFVGLVAVGVLGLSLLGLWLLFRP